MVDAVICQPDHKEFTKLRWQCRRGMLELDLLLQPFLEKYYKKLSPGNQAAFRKLLKYSDQELLELLMGYKIHGNREVADVTNKIRQAVTD